MGQSAVRSCIGAGFLNADDQALSVTGRIPKRECGKF